MITVPQLDFEIDIEWDREDALDLDYVRSRTARTRTREGPPPYWHGAELVGWAVLASDAPKTAWPGFCHYRRYFWLKESDRPLDPDGPFATDAPAEAVDPRTVGVGLEGEVTFRVHFGRDVTTR